jgi:UDP-2,4-diacetamido-2,4,6-trideoxy-beta-L-altropyranose hydrolase
MNIVFRVDSSSKIGAGHLMRCLTLADELKIQNHKVTFICRTLVGNLIDLIKKKRYKVITLPTDISFKSTILYLDWLGATQEQDLQQTIQSMPDNIGLLVVDSYALDKEWHQKLRPLTKKIMVIDDLANRKFDCDILLNQNLGSQKKDYKDKVSNECVLLLGCEYALLRPEFSKLRGQALERRKNTKEIKNILVSMGGDNNNITYNILQQLDDKFNIVVVLDKSSPHNEMILNYAQGRNIKVIVEAGNMAELMLEADLAIGAGGSTSWERCCLGLPTILYMTADNQREVVKNLEQLGAVMMAKSLKDDLQVIMSDFGLWQGMSNKAQGICNGLGVQMLSKNIN